MRPPDSPSFRLAVVILAAGASSRMGQPKMLLPWAQTTVLGHLIAQWRRLEVHQITVVCALGDEKIGRELDRIGLSRAQRVINASPAEGMFSSIQAAARWPGWQGPITHWAIALGDQPHLAEETLRAVGACAAQHPDKICQPSRNGRPRHPVFLPRAVFQSIARTRERTLKEYLRERASDTRLVEVNDPGLDFDLDTPSDYDEAQKRFPR